MISLTTAATELAAAAAGGGHAAGNAGAGRIGCAPDPGREAAGKQSAGRRGRDRGAGRLSWCADRSPAQRTAEAALRAWGGRRLCAVFAAGEPAVLRRTLRGSTAGPAATGRCGAARRSARGRAPEKAPLCINRKRINAGELANMQNTACGEYADNEYNIWWNMQMSR